MSTPWGRKGVSKKVDKNGQGEGGSLAVSGYLFSVAPVSENRALKGHFIIIFLR